MKPVSPVVNHVLKPFEVVAGEGQPEYEPLPLLPVAGFVLSRWRLTAEEREAIAQGADIVLSVMHASGPIEPVHMQVTGVDGSISLEHMKR